MNTHEAFIHAVRDLASARLNGEGERLRQCKLVYGIGSGRYRGITYYDCWQNGHESRGEFVEIAATCEDSWVQLAGTTVHELAHVLAGYSAGHGKGWREAYEKLGLRRVKAAGQRYLLANFEPSLRDALARMQKPGDGSPAFGLSAALVTARVKPAPCPLGIGTRGGRSRGKGSGSRLRLYVCSCEKPVKVRVASDTFNATCNDCGSVFKREEL